MPQNASLSASLLANARGEILESVDGAHRQPDAFVYGLLLNGNPLARNSELSHRLALADLKASAAGDLSFKRRQARPVALILCNRGVVETDTATARAATELIDKFNVSAIVSLSNGQVIATQRVIAARRKSVLHICEQCQASARESVGGIGDATLVFQALPARASFSPLIYQIVPEFERLARSLPHFDGSKSIRVALVASDYPAYAGLLADADRQLVINGSKAAEHGGTAYLRAIYTTPQTTGRFDPQATVRRVAQIKPHIVLGIGSIELATVYDTLERNLDASAPKPIYWGWTPTPALQAFIGENDDRRVRVYTFVSNNAPLTPDQRDRRAAALEDLSREFPNFRVAELFGFYGVPYQLLYAAAADVQQAPLTGTDLLRGMRATQQPGATEIYIGRHDLARGLAAISEGAVSLRNLNNAYPLDWIHQPAGEPSVLGARVHCYARNPTTRALEVAFVGPSWDRASGSVTGAFTPCR